MPDLVSCPPSRLYPHPHFRLILFLLHTLLPSVCLCFVSQIWGWRAPIPLPACSSLGVALTSRFTFAEESSGPVSAGARGSLSRLSEAETGRAPGEPARSSLVKQLLAHLPHSGTRGPEAGGPGGRASALLTGHPCQPVLPLSRVAVARGMGVVPNAPLCTSV